MGFISEYENIGTLHPPPSHYYNQQNCENFYL